MAMYETQDNRRHRRCKVSCPVTIYSSSDDMPTTTASGDLSDGGVFMTVSPSQAPAVDASVDLTFCVPRESSRIDCFSVAATVVRRDAAGVAMKFDNPIGLSLG